MTEGEIEDSTAPVELTGDLRVRIYELVADGQWSDRGTGCLFVREEEQKLVILDEVTQKEIMSHVVDAEIEYEQQGNTIISWLEPKTPFAEAMDLALSFQEPDACAATWEWISQLHTGLNNLKDRFPSLEKENLERIRQAIASPQILDWSNIHEGGFTGWFQELYGILKEGEENEDAAACENVHRILHELLKWAQAEVMQAFTDVNLSLSSQLLHIAEYHPHRKEKNLPEVTLRKRFKSISRINLPGVPFSEDMSQAINALFTLIFLRDVALLSLFEDTALSHFEHQIYHANQKVVMKVAEDRNFWTNLKKKFQELRKEDTAEAYDRLCIFVSFCHELIMRRCKIMKLAQRRDVILIFVQHGLLDCLYQTALAPHTTPHKHPLLWRLIVETVHQTYSGMGITEMKNHVTEYEKTSADEPTFLRKVLRCLHEPCDSGLQSQIIFLLRSILLFPDAQTPEAALFLTQAPKSHLSDIWRMFHDHHVDNLCTLLERRKECKLDDEQLQQMQIYIIDILQAMVKVHEFAMKRTILKNALMQKVAALISIPENKKQPIKNVQLNLSCIRFFRACIKKNESFFEKRIVTHHILDPVIDLFCRTHRSHNLLSSCFLSMIHPLIQDETRPNYQDLVAYVVERYLSRLEKVCPRIFQEFREKHEEELKQTQAEAEEIRPSDDEDKSEAESHDSAKETTPTKEAIFDQITTNYATDSAEIHHPRKKRRRKSESPMDFNKKQKTFHSAS